MLAIDFPGNPVKILYPEIQLQAFSPIEVEVIKRKDHVINNKRAVEIGILLTEGLVKIRLLTDVKGLQVLMNFL